MQFEAKELFLEVGEARFRCDLGVADTTGLGLLAERWMLRIKVTHRASSELVRLAVVVLVVDGVAVTLHSHDVGKHCAWAVVLVGIEEKAEALKLVCVTEDVSWLGALLGEPHSEAVAVEIALSVDLELEKDLLA